MTQGAGQIVLLRKCLGTPGYAHLAMHVAHPEMI